MREYEVRRVDRPEEWTTVHAYGLASAVEAWADLDDYRTNEYAIVKGDPATVLVRVKGEQSAKRFIVQGEQARIYSADCVGIEPAGEATS